MAGGGGLVRSSDCRRGDIKEGQRIIRDETRWHRAVERQSRRSPVDIRVDAGESKRTGS